jgi:hypothetical protein
MEPGTWNLEPVAVGYSRCVQQAYGTWPSPISAQDVATQGIRLGSVAVDGDDVYWLERRPNEGGRSVLVRCRADGRHEELTPQGFNVRTRVHEWRGRIVIVGRSISAISAINLVLGARRDHAGWRLLLRRLVRRNAESLFACVRSSQEGASRDDARGYSSRQVKRT